MVRVFKSEGIYMKKKILFVLVILSLVGFVGFAAETLDSKDLAVYGFIPAPEASAELEVESSLTGKGINLKENVDVQSDGSGVLVGQWKLTTYNQAGGEVYNIEYSYGTLESDNTNKSLAFNVYERAGTNGTPVSKATGDDTEITALQGTNSLVRLVYVKLTSDASDDVLDFPAADDYTATITLNLIGS